MNVHAAADYISGELEAVGNPENVAPMQAYLKTDMPFYGVKKPAIKTIFSAFKKQFDAPEDRQVYEDLVREMWSRDHREEKYVALMLANTYRKHIVVESMPLYEDLIREGAWWDFVDDVAARLVGRVFAQNRQEIEPVMRAWIDDDDLWIRRSALLSQLKHKSDTDSSLLFEFCEARAHEKEFFIRKAIGWVLRQYSYTEPEAVRDWLEAHWDDLSGLTRREGRKQLDRSGYPPRIDS